MDAAAEVILVDGAVGGELRRRAGDRGRRPLWPAEATLEAPELVAELHGRYLAAGADAITTNTYATVAARMLEAGLSLDWATSIAAAGRIAKETRDRAAPDALVLGSLPPLHGSFRPDEVGDFRAIGATYAEHAAALAPYVDVFLCETMSTALEARAAVAAAQGFDKPIWASWTIADDASGLLRSGESLWEAADALDGLAFDAILVNCAAPESVTAALPTLLKLRPSAAGGYANGFAAIPKGWRVAEGGVEALGRRDDLTPEAYADHVVGWVASGARIVGGCCETGPEHIAAIARRLGRGRAA